MNPKFLVSFAAAAIAFQGLSLGLGTRLPSHDASAVARGEAFAATADNPSAIYYNPAGITQLDGVQVRLGTYAIALDVSVDLDAPGPAFDSKYEQQYVPNFFATWSIPNSRFSIGLGTYAPFGLALEYPDDTPFRTLAKKGSITYLTINPVIAMKVTDSLSVAAGLMVNRASAELEQGVLAPGDKFRFEGDDVAIGFNLGLRWQPHRMHSFGVTYRSPTTMRFEGHTQLQYDGFTVPVEVAPGIVFPVDIPGADQTENAKADFRFPQIVVVGYSFRPTPDWNFEVNVDWTDWDNLNTVTVRQQKSADVSLPFNWESSFIYEFGVTRKLGTWSLSAGYIYSENSVPNESFNPIVPDTNRHIIAAGVGQELEHFNWALAYQYAYGPRRTIDQGTVADGNYRFQSHALTLSVGYRF